MTIRKSRRAEQTGHLYDQVSRLGSNPPRPSWFRFADNRDSGNCGASGQTDTMGVANTTSGSGAMVELSIAGGKLTLSVMGADKLWAFKSSLEIPLVHIAGVRADAEVAGGWWHGVRLPGTNVPGVITAGTFYQDGKRIFGMFIIPKEPSSLTCMTSTSINWL